MFPFFYGVIKGCFSPAFSLGGSVSFIVIDDTKFAVVYHFTVTLNIDCSACADYLFRIVCIFVTFQKIVFIMLANIWIFRPYINSFYVRVFLFDFCNEVET